MVQTFSTSPWERACIHLRHYYPHARCSDLPAYNKLKILRKQAKENLVNTVDTIVLASSYLSNPIPNPANTEASISYLLPKGTKEARIVIYDMLKGMVMKTYNLPLEDIKGSIVVSLSGFNSGIYAYSLIADEKQLDTKKMAVLK